MDHKSLHDEMVEKSRASLLVFAVCVVVLVLLPATEDYGMNPAQMLFGIGAIVSGAFCLMTALFSI